MGYVGTSLNLNDQRSVSEVLIPWKDSVGKQRGSLPT